jgi:hypothetical protein
MKRCSVHHRARMTAHADWGLRSMTFRTTPANAGIGRSADRLLRYLPRDLRTRARSQRLRPPSAAIFGAGGDPLPQTHGDQQPQKATLQWPKVQTGAVEQRDHPTWRGLQLVVGAEPGERGIVATWSYEARRFRRLPENYMPDRAGFSFAFKERRREHSRAM